MRRRGYALSELLVAVAIAGLIVGALTFLNVDYVSLGRRVADLQQPYELGGRAQAGDPCAMPGGVLVADNSALIAHGPDDNATILTLAAVDPERPGAGTLVSTPAGPAGTSRRPVRVAIKTAPAGGAAATPRAQRVGPASMATIEVGDATVGVVAPRCELPQVCTYDAANATCFEDEALAEPG